MVKNEAAESLVVLYKKEDVVTCSDIDFGYLLANMKDVNWVSVPDAKGRILRSSAWYTANGCSCYYNYGNSEWAPNSFLPWMDVLVKKVKDVFQYDKVPDAINFNKYVGKRSGLNWHADNEKIFSTSDNCVTILSLSLGASRDFLLLQNGYPESTIKTTALCDGDFLEMSGKVQVFYKHKVPFHDDHPSGIRYNLTFRWITEHEKRCSRNACSTTSSSCNHGVC